VVGINGLFCNKWLWFSIQAWARGLIQFDAMQDVKKPTQVLIKVLGFGFKV
jgi:hypothetical protein